MSNTILPQELSDVLDEILNEYLHSSFDKRQEALQAGAETLVDMLNQSAPPTSGLAGTFTIKYSKKGSKTKYKYKDRRYVGSTRTVSGKGRDGTHRDNIPLANIIEYGANGTKTKLPARPFIRSTFDSNIPQIYDTIKNKLK